MIFGEDIRQRRKTLRIVQGVALALSVLTIASAFFGVRSYVRGRTIASQSADIAKKNIDLTNALSRER